MEDKCPFCGATEIPMPEGRFHYACGTYGISEEGRSGQCWKAELAALRAALREAVAFIQAIARADVMTTVVRGVEYDTSLVLFKGYKEKAQAFLAHESVKRVMEDK